MVIPAFRIWTWQTCRWRGNRLTKGMAKSAWNRARLLRNALMEESLWISENAVRNMSLWWMMNSVSVSLKDLMEPKKQKKSWIPWRKGRSIYSCSAHWTLLTLSCWVRELLEKSGCVIMLKRRCPRRRWMWVNLELLEKGFSMLSKKPRRKRKCQSHLHQRRTLKNKVITKNSKSTKSHGSAMPIKSFTEPPCHPKISTWPWSSRANTSWSPTSKFLICSMK